ncbi:MAG: hypothetical protein JXB20_06675 [Bacilli bacterium]|nr:hypothetical protein [Bacilli bacterium]
MKIVQRIIFILALIIAALFFLYTLSFSTGWALGEPFGDFFTEAQIVNKILFKWALWSVIVSGINLMMNTHRNRKFYVQNYLTIVSVVVVFALSAVKLFELVPSLKVMYGELSEGMLIFITTFNFSEVGTEIFDLGIVVAYALFVQIALIIGFTIFKTVTQIKRAKAKKLSNSELSL